MTYPGLVSVSDQYLNATRYFGRTSVASGRPIISVPSAYLFYGNTLNVSVTVKDWFGTKTTVSKAVRIFQYYTIVSVAPYSAASIVSLRSNNVSVVFNLHIARCDIMSPPERSQPDTIKVNVTSGKSPYEMTSSESALSKSCTESLKRAGTITAGTLDRKKYYQFQLYAYSGTFLVASSNKLVLYVDVYTPKVSIVGGNRMIKVGEDNSVSVYPASAGLGNESKPLDTFVWTLVSCFSIIDGSSCNDSAADAFDWWIYSTTSASFDIPSDSFSPSQNITLQLAYTFTDGTGSTLRTQIYTTSSAGFQSGGAYIIRRTIDNELQLGFAVTSADVSPQNRIYEWTLVEVINMTYGRPVYSAKVNYTKQRYTDVAGISISKTENTTGQISHTINYVSGPVATNRILGVNISNFLPNFKYEFAVRDKNSNTSGAFFAFVEYTHIPEGLIRPRELVIAPPGGYGFITDYSFQIRVPESAYFDESVHQVWMNVCPSMRGYFPVTPPLILQRVFTMPLTHEICGTQISFILKTYRRGVYRSYGPFVVQTIESTRTEKTEFWLKRRYDRLKAIVESPGLAPAFDYFTAATQILETPVLTRSSSRRYIVEYILVHWNEMQSRILPSLGADGIVPYVTYFVSTLRRAVTTYPAYLSSNIATSLLQSLLNLTVAANSLEYSQFDDQGIRLGLRLSSMKEIMDALQALLSLPAVSKTFLASLESSTMIYRMLKYAEDACIKEALPTGIQQVLFKHADFGELQAMRADLHRMSEGLAVVSANDPTRTLIRFPSDMLSYLKQSLLVSQPATNIVGISVLVFKNLHGYNTATTRLLAEDGIMIMPTSAALINGSLIANSPETLEVGVYQSLITIDGTDSEPQKVGVPARCTENMTMSFGIRAGSSGFTVYHLNDSSSTWTPGGCVISNSTGTVVSMSCTPSVMAGSSTSKFALGDLILMLQTGTVHGSRYELFDIRNLKDLSNDVSLSLPIAECRKRSGSA